MFSSDFSIYPLTTRSTFFCHTSIYRQTHDNNDCSIQQPQQKQQQKCIPEPFWNSVSAQVSQQLWLPSSALDANEWGSETIAYGWANCLRWSSGAEVHDDLNWSVDENEVERSAKRPKLSHSATEPASKAKRYRLYPTAEEKKILVKWIGAARWTYNECLRAIMDEGVPTSKKALRASAINKETVELLKKHLARGDSLRYPERCDG
ncbi:hypothetical protein V1527DRAFT_458161 [Lipomyces starkeyi]